MPRVKFRARASIRVAAGLIVVLVLLSVGPGLWSLRESQRSEGGQVREAAETRAAQLADAVSERMHTLVRGTDFVLQQLRRNFPDDPGRLKARGDSLRDAFPDDALLNMALADATGDVIYSSSNQSGNVNIADRDYFDAHRAGADQLRIGGPLPGRVSQTVVLPFTRGVYYGGRFAGVAVVTLSPEGVSRILGRLELASHDVITLVNRQGLVLAHNRTPGAIGRTVSPARPFMLPGAASTGIYRTAGFADGKQRIFAWKQVGGTDLFAVIGLDLNTVLAPMDKRHQREWHYALTLSGMLLVLGAGMLYLLARLARGLREVALGATKLRQLIDGLGPDMLVGLLEPDGTIVEVNRPALNLAGLSPADVIGKHCEQTYWFAHSAEVQADIRSAIDRAAQGLASRFDLQIRAGQDRLAWIDFSLQPLRDEDGTVIYLVPSAMNIGSRKQAEADLRGRDLRLSGLIDSAMDAVVSINDAHEIILFNATAEKMFGHKAADVLGARIELLIPPVHRAAHDQHIERFKATGVTSRRMGGPGQVAGRRADGSEFPAEASISQLATEQGTIFTVILRDVSERQRADELRDKLEAQLRQAQKMEALGTLAGGIAHDFNNILAIVIGNAELALASASSGAAQLQHLVEIEKASRRARDLVRQILTFSRRQIIDRQVVSLRDVTQEAIALLRASLPAGIELVASFAPGASKVVADRSQLHQVLMNLGSNASQAMAGRHGRITISVLPVTLGEDAAAVGLPAGRYVRLSVADTGPGMDQATVARIFDPFFTTKPAGEGTGLGLAVVDGIVKSHGGAISVYTEPERGCTFHLYFPAGADDAVLAADAAPPVHSVGSGERILLVDDEESLVLIGLAMLRHLGYEAQGFTAAAQALAVFGADPAGFDLVLTDFNMPDISGLELAAQVLQLRPDLPVAISSGLITDEMVEQTRAAGVRQLIHKPYALPELAAALLRMLAKTR